MRSKKKPVKLNTFDFVNIGIMVIMMAVMVYPLWFITISAFSDGQDLMRGGVYLWPRKFTLDNFKAVFYEKTILNAFFITFVKCVVGTVTSVIFTTLVSYGLSRPNLKFKKFYIPFIMFTNFFGGGLIPYFLLINNIGLYDSFLVYIIPSLFSVWYMIVIQNYIRDLPVSLIESAKIDGASEYRIFLSIIIPLSTPVIAAVSLFTIVAHWNSYFDSMMYTYSNYLQTIQLYLKKVITDPSMSNGIGTSIAQQLPGAAQRITPQTIKMATMVVTAAPVIIVYPFVQKYFVKGVTIGAVKG